MHAGARHALRRAGGAGVAPARSSPAALHTVGQSVRAQRNRDEFTGVAGAVRVTWTLARSVACCWRGLRREGCGRRMRRSAESSSGRCRLSPCCCRELLPRLHPAQGTGLLRWQVATVWSVVTRARPRRSTRPSAWVHRLAPLSTAAQSALATARKIPTGEPRRVQGRGRERSMQRTALRLARPVLALRGGGPRGGEPEPVHVLPPL